MADAIAAAVSTDAASCSYPVVSSCARWHTRSVLLLGLLLLLARPASALFDPGEPIASSVSSVIASNAASATRSSATAKLVSSPLSAILAPLLKQHAGEASSTTGSHLNKGLTPFASRSIHAASLPPGCRRTTSFLRDICPAAPPNADLNVRGALWSPAALRSELVLCPLPHVEPLAPQSGVGAAEGAEPRETTWAVSGTVTLVGEAPGELLASYSSSSTEASLEMVQQGITTTAKLQGSANQVAEEQWPEEGADGFWRHVDGVPHWVPATPNVDAKQGMEKDMSPLGGGGGSSGGDAPASVTPPLNASTSAAAAQAHPSVASTFTASSAPPIDASSSPVLPPPPSSPSPVVAAAAEPEADAARAAYSKWSASVGGEGSSTWLSFAQWRAAHEEALREAAAAKGKKEESRKRGAAAAAAKKREEAGAEAQGKEGGEKVTPIQEEANVSATTSGGEHQQGTPVASTSHPSSPSPKSAHVEPPTPSSSSTVTSLEPNSIPAVANPASQLATLKHRWNFASLDCAAVVHRSNPSAKFASAVLSEKKDRYMLSPCPASAAAASKTEGQFIIVELCDEISIDTIVLANYEFFSRMFKRFRVRVARKLQEREEDWVDIGTFRARNVRGLQVFNTPPPKSEARFFRYVRLDFLEHYGSEYYCPVSLLRVYGLTQMDDYIREEEELKREREREAAGLLIEADAEASEQEAEAAEYEEGMTAKVHLWNEKETQEEDKWKEWDETLRRRAPAEANQTDFTPTLGEAEAALSADTQDATAALQPDSSPASEVTPSAAASATNDDLAGYAGMTGVAEMGVSREMPLPPANGLLNATGAHVEQNVSSALEPDQRTPTANASTAQGHVAHTGSASSYSANTTTAQAHEPTQQASVQNAPAPAQDRRNTTLLTASGSNATSTQQAYNATAPLVTAEFASRNVSVVSSGSASESTTTSSAGPSSGTSIAAETTQSANSAVGVSTGTFKGTAETTRSAFVASTSSSNGSAPSAAAGASTASSSVAPASATASQAGSSSPPPPPPPPVPEVPAGRSSSGTSGHSGSSGSGSGSGSGGGSESIYRTITKRLNTLEANATLSLQYIEHSGQMLREVFARMERKQEERMGEMLRALNASNWRQIDGLKRRQQVDLQQAIFEFDVHRQRTDAERNRLVAELHVLASEVLLEKRFGIAQLILLLGLFIFMALTRGSRAAPLLHSGLARISGTPRQARPPALRSGTNTETRRASEDAKASASGKRPTHGRSESSTSAVPRSTHAHEGTARKGSAGLGGGLAPLREPLRSVQAGTERLPRSTPASFERTVRRPSVNRSARPASLATSALRAAATGSLSGTPSITTRPGSRTSPLRLKIPVPSSSDFAEMSQEELRSWLGFLTPIHASDTASAPLSRHHHHHLGGEDGSVHRDSTRAREARMARSETITKLAMHAQEAGDLVSAPARLASTHRAEGAAGTVGDESLSSDWGTERSEDDEDSTADSGFESESIRLKTPVGQPNGGGHHVQQRAEVALRRELDMQRSPTISPPRTLKALNAPSSISSLPTPTAYANVHQVARQSSPHLASVFPSFPRTPADLESDADDDESASGEPHAHRWTGASSSSSRPRRSGSHRERRHTARPGSAGSLLGGVNQSFSASPGVLGTVAAVNAGSNGGLLVTPLGIAGPPGMLTDDATPQRVASPLARPTAEPEAVDPTPTSTAVGVESQRHSQ